MRKKFEKEFVAICGSRSKSKATRPPKPKKTKTSTMPIIALEPRTCGICNELIKVQDPINLGLPQGPTSQAYCMNCVLKGTEVVETFQKGRQKVM